MPWHIVDGHSECPSSRSFAVVKDSDGSVVGCHATRSDAEDQLAALHASERSRPGDEMLEHAVRPAVEVRESVLTGVDFKQRLIDVIAVPYEQEAEVMYRGELWRETFDPHAFDGIEEHAGRVRVNREHIRGDTVGKVVHFDPSRNDGLLARVKVAKTVRGDETLALADDDMLSASVGYMVRGSDQRLDKRNKLRRVMRAFMDHLAMVEQPAFDGAKVLTVREGLSVPAEASQEPLSTPALDAYLNDDVLSWTSKRFAQ